MKVRFFTHGEKREGYDPHMTERGSRQVASLRECLPAKIPVLWLGEATRHYDVVMALGLMSFHNRRCSAVWGACGSAVKRPDGDYDVLFRWGSMPMEHVTSGADGSPSVRAKILTLPDGAIVCAGREVLIALGLTLAEAKSAACYEVEHDGTAIVAGPTLIKDASQVA